MKIVNPAVSTAIRSAYNVQVLPRLTAEWNVNRYAPSVVADNIPAEAVEGYDPDMFPIESIISNNRPTKGIAKARINEGRVSDGYETPMGTRYYVASEDDLYKYWTSPHQSSGSGVFANHSDGQPIVRPHVLYGTSQSINKIVIGLENSWTNPLSYQVLIKSTPAAAWNYGAPIATNPTINAAGQIVLWHTGGGAWSTTKPAVAPLTSVAGIMLKVSTTNRPSSFISVIEIAGFRVEDLTDRMISVDDTQELGEPSMVYPLGTLTANTGNLSLSNVDGYFDNDNPASPFRGILEPNVTFNLEYIYHVNGTTYPVQAFKMTGGEWSGQKDETVTVELRDGSKYLQEVKPQPTMYLNLNASEIVWRLCDQAGFNDYVIDSDDLEPQPRISVFWTDGEQTLWEVFDELARATQTAIYFDSWNRLQIKSRWAAFKSAKTPDWTLRGQTVGNELADIISLEQTDEFSANNITVTYQTTEFSEPNHGFPKMDRVWEPDSTVVLRSSPLFQTLTTTDGFLHIPPQDADIWPYEGLVQVQGELIRYKGKRYTYLDGGTNQVRIVNSADEKEKLDNRTVAMNRYQNHFTGALAITERGVWNSERKRHAVEAEGYSVRNMIGGTGNSGVGGFRHDRQNSLVTMSSTPKVNSNQDYIIATRGVATDSGFYYYGTRFKFNEPTRTGQKAGLVIHNNGNNEDGYYIELQPTIKTDRAAKNELIFYSRKSGTPHRFGLENGMGKPLNIIHDTFYDLDVVLEVVGGTHNISIMVNGVNAMNVSVTSNQNAFGGRFGMFVRSDTSASFEYLYAVAQTEFQRHDNTAFYDRVRGGYSGGQWDREWVYRWRDVGRRKKKITSREQFRWNRMFMDEFGPYVHEVREYDVKFDPKPVLHSRIYMTNDWGAICTSYSSDAFGAKFVLANTSRSNAVLNGEDKINYAGTTTTVNQLLIVYGRALIIRDSETVNVKNENQIRKRGQIDAEVTSNWIQSKEAAEKLARWISNHWGTGADQQMVTVFGNPLFELGDVVTIDYPDRSMAVNTHKYFVVGISNSFDQGLETTLTLRRVN